MNIGASKYRPPLEQRAINLLRRGFDVPPSKELDYQTYRRAGYRLDEIKEIMKLE